MCSETGGVTDVLPKLLTEEIGEFVLQCKHRRHVLLHAFDVNYIRMLDSKRK